MSPSASLGDLTKFYRPSPQLTRFTRSSDQIIAGALRRDAKQLLGGVLWLLQVHTQMRAAISAVVLRLNVPISRYGTTAACTEKLKLCSLV